jgi:hypothetical protein
MGGRAEGQKGKMDGIMRRGIVICNAVPDSQDSSSQIESGNGRQKATDPVQIGSTQSVGGGCEPHSCFGLRYQYGFGLSHTSSAHFIVGLASVCSTKSTNGDR